MSKVKGLIELGNQQLINEIHNSLQLCSQEELQHLLHVVQSIEESREGSFYYLGRFLGINILNADEVTMNLGMQNANTYGIAQGGAIYTLADIALGYKILTTCVEESKALTIELKVNYIKQGSGSKLYAYPTILHFGKTTVVGQCSIMDNQKDLVAVALGTFHVKPTTSKTF